MRFERRGGPPDLQAAFKHFIRHRLQGRALDDNQDAEPAAGRFPDFACHRDLLLIEMKHLEDDQHDRVNDVFDKKVDPNEKPVFFGLRDGMHVINNISNGEAVKQAIASKLSRTIEGILRSANGQFASYRQRHSRKNSVCVCVILNSALREFSPEMINHAIFHKMRQPGSTEQRFPAIDAVLYFTEKHFKKLPDGRIAFAIAVYEGASLETETWKQPIVWRIVDEWSRMRTGDASVPSDDPTNFGLVDDIPDKMARSDLWNLEYRRNPYLRRLPIEKLRVLFNRCMALNSRTFVKGSWPKPPRKETQAHLQLFAHLIEESNQRGIDMREFGKDKLTPAERAEVYQGLPAELVEILGGRSQP